MSNYVSSSANRFYVALESQYGAAASVQQTSRIPAVKLSARQQLKRITRRDKTGGRTFLGRPVDGRRKTQYELQTYMASWADKTKMPCHDPLFQAALGNAGTLAGGCTVASTADGQTIRFSAAHGFGAGQAVCFGGEMRFVSAIPDPTSVVLHAPFTLLPGAGTVLGTTATYRLGSELPSVSVYDYWDPSTTVQRSLVGAAVDELRVSVNGDYHEFQFSGPASDLIDSVSFQNGQGQLSSFPAEPAQGPFNYGIVPGNLGQVWLGATPNRFYSITQATFKLRNRIEAREQEFGSNVPRAVSGGVREIGLEFSLYAEDQTANRQLYAASRSQSPMPVMVQLGQQSGQLFGVYVASMIADVPQFDDRETRLQWKFSEARAQGTYNDEVVVAFG